MRGVILRAVVLAVALCAAAPYIADATQGGDISQYYDAATFECVRSKGGWEFIIVRGYCSFGGVDSNGRATLEQAIAAGMPYHDYYHFPCAYGVGAASQVQTSVSAMSGVFGMMWFDIETNYSPNCGWSGDLASNCNFLSQLIAEGHNLGVHMGIYASAYMWGSIMGDGCSVGADNGLALWYADYDYEPNFNGFTGFGGWGSPAMKQYWDSVDFGCTINSDADWYPN